MTNQQQIFADEYLIDLNATRAYKAAYPRVKSDETAAAAGARLLRNVKVDGYIQAAMAERQKRTEVTADRVIEELAKMAFFDVRRMVDDDGRPIPIQSLDDGSAAAIAGLDIVDYYEAGDEGKKEFAGWVKKYKLADKKGALELLGKHLGMFTDKLQLSGEVKLDDARARLAEKLNKDGQ